MRLFVSYRCPTRRFPLIPTRYAKWFLKRIVRYYQLATSEGVGRSPALPTLGPVAKVSSSAHVKAVRCPTLRKNRIVGRVFLCAVDR
jgi:hypothetical protein